MESRRAEDSLPILDLLDGSDPYSQQFHGEPC